MMSFGQSPWSKGCVHEFIVHVKPVHLPKHKMELLMGAIESYLILTQYPLEVQADILVSF